MLHAVTAVTVKGLSKLKVQQAPQANCIQIILTSTSIILTMENIILMAIHDHHHHHRDAHHHHHHHRHHHHQEHSCQQFAAFTLCKNFHVEDHVDDDDDDDDDAGGDEDDDRQLWCEGESADKDHLLKK